MKNSDEMVNSLFERREQYLTEKKKQHRTIMKTAICVSSLCLVALFGFGIWQSGLLRQSPIQTENPANISSGNQVSETSALATDKEIDSSDIHDFSIIWADNANDGLEGFTTWNNHDSISFRLCEALESGNKDDVFAIFAMPAKDYTFEYKGKTLADYYLAMSEERNLPDKLLQLLKEGDSLKYGEALYKTGTPTGEIWYQSLYEERVAFYGNTILEKYIVDGQFLVEELERDIAIATNSTQATDAYNKALTAYLEQLAASVHGVLPLEAVPEKFGIIMYHTKDQFSAFINNSDDDIDTTEWTFRLAANESDDESFGIEE